MKAVFFDSSTNELVCECEIECMPNIGHGIEFDGNNGQENKDIRLKGIVKHIEHLILEDAHFLIILLDVTEKYEHSQEKEDELKKRFLNKAKT